MDEFNDLRKNRDSIRRRIGDSAYEGFLNLFRRQIQERLLGYAAIRPKDLAAMYNTASGAGERARLCVARGRG